VFRGEGGQRPKSLGYKYSLATVALAPGTVVIKEDLLCH
jgi:hypothetical protein